MADTPHIDLSALTSDLAQWIEQRTSGDPAAALTALGQVTAEILKLAPDPPGTYAKFLGYLDRFMALPNLYFGVAKEERSH